jgi:hypothetical protein
MARFDHVRVFFGRINALKSAQAGPAIQPLTIYDLRFTSAGKTGRDASIVRRHL